MSFYTAVKKIADVAVRMIFRLRIVGGENVPQNGGAILALNHRSNWDVVIAGVSCKRPLSFMAKSEMFENKIGAALFRGLGAFPVKRGRGDVAAIKTAMEILSAQRIMLMFPEGKRIKDGSKVKAKTGAVMIANRTETPIIPVNISGKYRFRSLVTVTYGTPVYYSKNEYGKISSENLQELSDKLLDNIRELGV